VRRGVLWPKIDDHAFAVNQLDIYATIDGLAVDVSRGARSKPLMSVMRLPSVFPGSNPLRFFSAAFG